MRPISFLLGAGAGAAAAWLGDPRDGARRRNLVRDKAIKYARSGAAEAKGKARHAGGAVRGAAGQAGAGRGGSDAAERLNDQGLAAKVESEIFRDVDTPKGEVSVNVEEGIVYLRGTARRPEAITQLGRAAGRVAGVRGVENRLHRPGEPVPEAEEAGQPASAGS